MVVESSQREVTRRGFLKTAAATGLAASFAGGALSACKPKPTPEPTPAPTPEPEPEPMPNEEIYSGACRGFCMGGCALNLHVRDGKLVRCTAADFPDTRYNRICPKGLTHPHRVYSPNRIQYPMKRTGERGSGQFKRITWDEAINEIATQWKKIAEESGWGAIAAAWLTGNRGTIGGSHSVAYFQRLIKKCGITTLVTLFDAVAIPGLTRHLGQSPLITGNEPADLLNAKFILVWGANPAVCQMQTYHFILEAHAKGAKVINIDPIYTQNAALADEYIPIRAASDGALALGMMKAIVDNGWTKEAYLRDKTVAPFLVKKSDGKFLRKSDLGEATAGAEDDEALVMAADGTVGAASAVKDAKLEVSGAKVKGIAVDSAYSLLLGRLAEFPLDKVSQLTGVPESKIVEIANQYANTPESTIYCVYASDHYTNGHYNFSGYSCLGALTGNVGRSGAFVGSSPMGAPILNSAGALNVESVGTPTSVMLTKFPEVVLEGTYNGAPRTIRSLLISYMNLVNADTDRNLNIQVYKKLDFIVAIDFMMTESCEWADIVLPAAHWFEVEDVLCHSNHHPYAVYQDPCLEPAFESKPDFEIINLLAKALGFESEFNFTQSEYLKLCFDTDKAKALGISYDTLKQKKIIRWVPEGTYISFEGQNFLTPSKRAEFYLENPKPTNAYPAGQVRSKELLPYWEPPLEAWPEEGAKYPLHCVFFRMKYMGHTQWSDIEVLRELDIEPYVKINPADAKPRGIANGDKVRIFNDRGYVVMKANLVENFPPGIIGVPKGFQKKQFIDGHASELTHKTMNGFMANNCFFDVAVEIEKM